MAPCGCKKSAKQRAAAKAKAEAKAIEYKVNGSQPVKLGLKTSYPLPLRLPSALNGQDVVIVPNRVQAYPTQGAIVVYGRNAKVSKEDKKQLAEKWPGVFVDA